MSVEGFSTGVQGRSFRVSESQGDVRTSGS